MSKSSDSITAAKLLAESRQKEGSNLRINQDMSKSIERQLDVYTKTREEIRNIIDSAKACSVQDRIKLFNRQAPLVEPVEITREEKAEAIRREILEAKALGHKPTSDGSDTGSGDIQIQSPIEAKVKPLKIPLKPKLVEADIRPEPGTKLRINQATAAPQQVQRKSPEIKSILRTSRSIERSRKSSLDAEINKRRTPSVDTAKSQPIIIEPSSPKINKPKSILIKKSSDPTTRKRSPKLVHSNSLREGCNMMKIYAQSATDMSATEDDMSERSGRKISAPPIQVHSNGQYLQVPLNSEASGLRKSKSFASPGQYECSLSEKEVNAKQKTIMAFFDASLTNPPQQVPPNPSQIPKSVANIPSAVIKRSSAAAAIHQKRGSITSISDEILGDDDLKDVDAVFESLLNSTFQEIQARGREAASLRGGAKKRSASSHPTVTRSSTADSVGSAPKESSGKSTNKRGAVNRKQSKNKLVAGEVKSVIQEQQPNQQEQSMNKKEVLADPIAALPTSHTKKYVPRQQSWASPSPPPSAATFQSVTNQTPSPTQSEYDTCPDPWEDY